MKEFIELFTLGMSNEEIIFFAITSGATVFFTLLAAVLVIINWKEVFK